MESKHSKSTICHNIKDISAQFHEEPLFADAADSYHSDPFIPISQSTSISDIDNTNANSFIHSKETPESPSPSSSAHLNHRRHPRNLKDNGKLNRKLNSAGVRSSSSSLRKLLTEESNDNSAITTTVNADESINLTDSSVSSISGSNFLLVLAGFMIKVIGFQFNLFCSSVTLPIWILYYSYIFMIDPFRIMNLAKHYTLMKISETFTLCCNFVKWIMHIWIRKHESTSKLCIRIGWGLLWSVYVGFILTSLLVSAFVISGIILKRVIEEPIRITTPLNFDYTKDSPTAFVPLISCIESAFLDYSDPIRSGSSTGSRVIPVNHKVHATVSLTLPESSYNRNLGIFQVRVDFLSGDGKRVFSTRKPCMLRYKSQPVRLLLTFLKLAPLITGYVSESQTVKVKSGGYTEGPVPTSCVMVIVEQRAEFTRGAGVPVIYEAYLKLESQPPFLKRVLWSWKWSLYIWTTVMVFVMELLVVLVCCSSVIVPRLQPRGGSLNSDGSLMPVRPERS